MGSFTSLVSLTHLTLAGPMFVSRITISLRKSPNTRAKTQLSSRSSTQQRLTSLIIFPRIGHLRGTALHGLWRCRHCSSRPWDATIYRSTDLQINNLDRQSLNKLIFHDIRMQNAECRMQIKLKPPDYNNGRRPSRIAGSAKSSCSNLSDQHQHLIHQQRGRKHTPE